MPVADILRRFLGSVESHAKRLEALVAAVTAALTSRSLSSASLGRASGGLSAKHAIKRFDRLLGNHHLYEEIPLFYEALAHAVVVEPRPVILIDWTQLRGQIHALVASVAGDGRSHVVLAQAHHSRKLGNSHVQESFLEQLRKTLPAGCKPIIVSDAGFHGDFFRKIIALGWHFVGRIRGTARIAHAGEKLDKSQLYARARPRAQDFPGAQLYALNPIQCRLALIRHPRSKRRSKPTRSKELIEYRKSARDPWLLATSIERKDMCAADVIGIYARRMQIEESFRDVKSSRFGLNLEQSRSRSLKRLAVQFLIASLALFVAMRIGQEVEAAGAHRRMQANSVRTRRVLSLVRLGFEFIQRARGQLRELSLASLIPHFRGDP